MSGRVWTDEEVAADWKCTIQLVQLMFRDGRLRGFKAGRGWRIVDSAKAEYEQGEDARRVAS